MAHPHPHETYRRSHSAPGPLLVVAPLAVGLLVGCGVTPKPPPPEFDPGRCRAGAAQMQLDAPIQGRLDVAAGDQGGCWRLEIPAGTLEVVVNLDQPENVEGPALRLTDAIGQPLARSAVGVLGTATRVSHDFEAQSTVIVELRASKGASSFGMQAHHSPPKPPPAPPPVVGDAPDGVESTPGPRPRPRPTNEIPVVRESTAPPPAVKATCTRIRPLKTARGGVELMGRFADGETARVDWSGPIVVMDGETKVGVARLESHGKNHAVVKAESLTRHRAKGCTLRFTPKAK